MVSVPGYLCSHSFTFPPTVSKMKASLESTESHTTILSIPQTLLNNFQQCLVRNHAAPC